VAPVKVTVMVEVAAAVRGDQLQTLQTVPLLPPQELAAATPAVAEALKVLKVRVELIQTTTTITETIVLGMVVVEEQAIVEVALALSLPELGVGGKPAAEVLATPIAPHRISP